MFTKKFLCRNFAFSLRKGHYSLPGNPYPFPSYMEMSKDEAMTKIEFGIKDSPYDGEMRCRSSLLTVRNS